MAMMWLICRAPTMIWSVVLGLCVLMNDGLPDDEVPFPDWSCVVQCD